MELETDRIVTYKTEVTKEEAQAFAKDRLEHVAWELRRMNADLQLQPVVFTKAAATGKSELHTGWTGCIDDKDQLADEEDFNRYFRDSEPE